MRKSRHKPVVLSQEQLCWLAGLLEGEGCFYSPKIGRKRWPAIRLEMCDKDVVEKVSRLWGRKLIPVKHMKPRRKQLYITKVVGFCALELMKLLRPHMGARRGKKIDELVHAGLM